LWGGFHILWCVYLKTTNNQTTNNYTKKNTNTHTRTMISFDTQPSVPMPNHFATVAQQQPLALDYTTAALLQLIQQQQTILEQLVFNTSPAAPQQLPNLEQRVSGKRATSAECSPPTRSNSKSDSNLTAPQPSDSDGHKGRSLFWPSSIYA
jgi:hypothetical protein